MEYRLTQRCMVRKYKHMELLCIHSKYLTINGRGWAKYRDLSVASRSIICQRLRQITDLRDTGKSRYFAKTEFNNCFIIRSPSLFLRSTEKNAYYSCTIHEVVTVLYAMWKHPGPAGTFRSHVFSFSRPVTGIYFVTVVHRWNIGDFLFATRFVNPINKLRENSVFSQFWIKYIYFLYGKNSILR